MASGVSLGAGAIWWAPVLRSRTMTLNTPVGFAVRRRRDPSAEYARRESAIA